MRHKSLKEGICETCEQNTSNHDICNIDTEFMHYLYKKKNYINSEIKKIKW